MAYQTLYRKYRPKSFELVFGQNTITKTLTNIIKNNKLSHAYLFTGPRGTGKTSCAKLFAKAINCLNNKDGDACNECANCITYNENSNPDIIEIDAASNNGVDEIREIRNKVNLVPSISKYKVYIIDEVHMLSIGAFNALLKTLEEPPEYIIFILATTEPQKIPATIISRCQRFDFKNIFPEEMKKCLERIVKEEKIEIEDDALNEIISNSNGGMRDAIGMLDQAFAFCDKKITKNDIEELYGTISKDEIIQLLNDIKSNNYENILLKTNKWYENGKDFILLTQKILIFLQNGIISKKTKKKCDNNSQIYYDENTDSYLYELINDFSEILSKLQLNFQKKIIFEINIIKLIDKNSNNNVSRETSKENESTIKDNVSRETLQDENINLTNKIHELNLIRINNIILKSKKEELLYVDDKWKKLNEYLLNENYKKIISMLLNGKPVAASEEGIIVSIQTKLLAKKLTENYDIVKKILNELFLKKYKVVFVSEEWWQEQRPIFVEKMRNKKMNYLKENDIINEIKKETEKKSVNQFDELIEMEAK